MPKDLGRDLGSPHFNWRCTMDDLYTVPIPRTLQEFEQFWKDLGEEGWRFRSTIETQDEGKFLLFTRTDIGLGNTGTDS
jgi:hypothetical protein